MEDPIRRLRDRTAITRLLILAELGRRAGTTLSDVAASLGITVQAVSAHAKELTRSGRLGSDENGYQVSPRGLQALHEGVRQLRDAVAGLAAPLDVIQVTSAVAASAVKVGDEVGLFMENGELAARPAKDAPSRGRARNAARVSDEVVVGELRGMVKLEPGHVTVVSVPGPSEGGIARIERASLRQMTSKHAPDRVGAHGTGASILARAQGEVHFEFAADRAAFNAAERGLDVLLYVSRDRLAEVMESFDRLNTETLRRVPIELIEAPERHG